jgi:zinc/manganese transport system substrate-binding protein
MPVLSAVMAAVVLAACGTPRTTTSGGALRVVAAESPWGAVASALGGRNVAVTSLVADPNTDPHDYQPTAAAAAAVAQAGVVIDNGLGYDTFMTQLLSPGGAPGRRVVTAASVLGVQGPGANPHLWYAVQRIPEVASAIATALERADPTHANAYRSNLARFDASLVPLTSSIAAIRARKAGTPVAQTERVAGYLLAEAGLVVASPLAFALAVESGQNPSAQATHDMETALSGRRVAALVLNEQTTSPVTSHATALAATAGVPVVKVSEVVLPVGTSYVRWQRGQIASLAAALRVSS